MHTPRETTRPGEPRDTDQALPTILRGEEVLDQARDVAEKISGRVHRALAERPPQDGRRPDWQ